MKKNLLLISFIIALMALVFLYQRNAHETFTDTSAEASLKADSAEAVVANNESVDSNSKPSDPFLQKAANVSEAFKTWFAASYVEVEKSSVDPQKVQEDLTRKAFAMNAEERLFLFQKVLSTSSKATEKMFSAYVLGLNPEQNTAYLELIAKAPLVYIDAAVHSPEETLQMQEKALRRMAIESLLNRAAADPSYKRSLSDLASQIQDPALKKFLEKKLSELN